MNEKKLVPRRRFEEFQNADAWEQLRLEEISDIRTGPFGSTLHAKDYVKEGTPIITTEHFKNGDLPKQKDGIPQVSAEDLLRLQSYVLKTDDIVFSRVGSVDINALVTPFQRDWLFSGRVLRVRTNNSIDSQYMHYELSTSRAKNDVISRAVGQTMPSINTEILKQTRVFIPTEIKEQKQIGAFLSNLDNLITLHQRKLEKTKAMKSAYLAEMFPAECERVPKRRFTGFIKDWQKTMLGKLGNTYSGMSGKTKEDFGHGDAEFVTYMNVFKNEISDTSLTEKVVLDNKQTEVKYGDVLFTTSSETPHEVGLSSIWLDNRPNVYLNSFCFGFRPTSEMNKLYLAYLLRSNEVRNQIEILAQGISRYNISKGKVMEITISIPDYEEQQAIGEFFKKLDDSITNQQQKLKKLKAMKQAYLAEMFV